jgi:hypothetical protein
MIVSPIGVGVELRTPPHIEAARSSEINSPFSHVIQDCDIFCDMNRMPIDYRNRALSYAEICSVVSDIETCQNGIGRASPIPIMPEVVLARPCGSESQLLEGLCVLAIFRNLRRPWSWHKRMPK